MAQPWIWLRSRESEWLSRERIGEESSGKFTRGFAAREFSPRGKLAAPPPLARSRIPPATQARMTLNGLEKIESFCKSLQTAEEHGEIRILLMFTREASEAFSLFKIKLLVLAFKVTCFYSAFHSS